MTTATKPFKVGDKVAFEHLGMEKKGEIIELAGDGRVRIKDGRGLMYRYSPENVSHEGDPIVKDPKPVAITGTATTQSATTEQTTSTQISTKQPTEPMAKKEKAPKAAPAAGTADAETIKKIVALECKKHQRVYLLLDAGCTKEEAMEHGKANAGEVSNVRKQYQDEAKVAAAKALLV